MVLISELVNLL